MLWVATLILLRNWQYFRRAIWLNGLLLMSYLYVLSTRPLSYLEHDEYGLGRLSTILTVMVVHILLGLLIVIGLRVRQYFTD